MNDNYTVWSMGNICQNYYYIIIIILSNYICPPQDHEATTSVYQYR